MDRATRVTDLGQRDLPAIGALFAEHTGRQADLDVLGSWIRSWPAAGAYRDDTLVGYAICKSFAPDIAELASLLIHPSERGRGLGSSLVRSVEEAGVGRGLHAMVAVTSTAYDVQGVKASARPLYERLGYAVLLETPSSSVMGRSLVATE